MNTIHILGDSISIQYGPYLQQYLQNRLIYSRKTEDPDPTADANGGDSNRVLTYLQWCASRGNHWDYLVVNCGLHDIRTDPASGRRQVEPENYVENLRAIIRTGQPIASHLIWIRTTPVIDAVHNQRSVGFQRYAADVHRYNELADEVMQAAGIPMIDLYQVTANLGGEELFVDHVHFTETVKQLQAAFIAGSLYKICPI